MCLAIPGKILEIDNSGSLTKGKVSFGGIIKDICLVYVPEAKTGDYVLVHVGFAITIIDEKEAEQVFSYLDQINELAELGY